jgi:DNA-binding response OmpR family regulator
MVEAPLRALAFARDLLESFADEVVAVDVGAASTLDRPDADLVVVARDAWQDEDTALSSRLQAQRRAVPVFALSGSCDSRHGAAALRAGADEFLAIPFDVEEFVARAVALVRRASRRARQARVGPISVDFARRQIFVDGRLLPLTLREYDLVAMLIDRVGEVVTRRELAGDAVVTAARLKVIDVHMSRIRDKVGAHAACIETVRGKGYRLRIP